MMAQNSCCILSAPYILPIDQPPIQNGAIVIQNDSIIDLGKKETLLEKYKQRDFQRIDLPKTVLLPGFVNAHSHLELTSLENLTYPGSFTEWIRKIVELKSKISEQDYQEGIKKGIDWMLRTGTTTIGDHVSFNTDLELILKSPLRGILFIEVLGVVKEVSEDILEAARNLEKIFSHSSSLFKTYPSPHSVHALHSEILPKLFTETSPVLSIHLAESAEEDEYFKKNSGPLHRFINQRLQSSSNVIPLRSNIKTDLTAIQHLEAKRLLSEQIMAVHCNYLDEKDFDLLEKEKISVVHCPSSHRYFSHQKFPLKELRERNINIALGTDSLSSGESLSMLDQIRIAKKNYPEINNEEWLELATLGGANALKMEKEIGSLSIGKKADLIGLKVQSKNPKEMIEEILESKQANFVMINGKKIFNF